PAELLTQANHILGKGQLSLAKFLFITADDSNQLSTHNIPEYFKFLLERIDLTRDLHFYTNTTIDTLDYSGSGLNSGSKVVFAAYGDKKRELATTITNEIMDLKTFNHPFLALPGVLVLQANKFVSHEKTEEEISEFNIELIRNRIDTHNYPLIVICDDSDFTSATLNNWLWVSFTRCNPSHDIY
ncbi:MAG TPA: UbiD family decarboxylase, partial [Bacteroidia bacterium]|nr:UbiD family decarboxylase [Bacteroidia bacterium]